jgi:hypothetical protein
MGVRWAAGEVQRTAAVPWAWVVVPSGTGEVRLGMVVVLLEKVAAEALGTAWPMMTTTAPR